MVGDFNGATFKWRDVLMWPHTGGTLGDLWRHFWLSQVEVSAADLQRIEAKDAAKCPAMHRAPLPEKNDQCQILNHSQIEKTWRPVLYLQQVGAPCPTNHWSQSVELSVVHGFPLPPDPNAESITMNIVSVGVEMLFKIIIPNTGINAQLQLEHW